KDQRTACKFCGYPNPPHRAFCDKCNEYIGTPDEEPEPAPQKLRRPEPEPEPAPRPVHTTAEVPEIRTLEDLERLGDQTTAPLGTGQLMWPGFMEREKPQTDSKYRPGYIYFEQPGTDKVLRVKHRIGEMDIGRRDPKTNVDPEVDLNMFEAKRYGVSRVHARLWCSGTDVRVQDMGSTNGTWVEGKRLPKSTMHPVNSQDIVRFGSLVLRVIYSTSPGHLY
ncbi:MAG: FHA domain-containing protein, partial [Chloroflexota bacterium]